jgi:hypothetical protein
MATIDEQTKTELLELSGSDLVAFFDEQARQRLGMSGDEFRRRLDAGEFDDISDDPFGHPDVTHLSILASFLR